MKIDSSNPFYYRVKNTEHLDEFVGRWLVNLEEQDLNNPIIGIINGWMAEHSENQWYADSLANDLSIFAFDSRGQGQSPKSGRMDAVQGAIDANYIISKAFAEYDWLVDQSDRVSQPANKILQGSCIGTMPIAALFAGRLPLHEQIDATILISPIAKFSPPTILKIGYFIPLWLASFVKNYLTVPIANMLFPGEDSQFSRDVALDRVNKLHPPSALQQAKELLWKEDVSNFWNYVNVPSLILVSSTDPLTPIDLSVDVYHKLPFPIWFELEAPDHLILEDNWEYLQQKIPEFARDPWDFYERYKHLEP